MRSIAEVGAKMFYFWANNSVKDTSHLPRHVDKILLAIVGLCCHMTYKNLRLLGDKVIVVAVLPAHTSHVLQTLGSSVFRPLKKEFKQLLGQGTVITDKSGWNDIFTVCDLFCNACHCTVTPQNVITGF